MKTLKDKVLAKLIQLSPQARVKEGLEVLK
jgi:hypothetical protein